MFNFWKFVDCQDSSEEEWTCDSSEYNYAYCWQEASSNYISDVDSHKSNSYSTGSGSHCGCLGSNGEYNTVTLNIWNNRYTT